METVSFGARFKFVSGWLIEKTSFLLWCGILYDIWSHHPDNHYEGFGACLFVAWGVILIANLINMIVQKRLFLLRMFAHFSILFILLISNVCNINVTYEEWTQRGMPEWGEYRTNEHLSVEEQFFKTNYDADLSSESRSSVRLPAFGESVGIVIVAAIVCILLRKKHPCAAIIVVIVAWAIRTVILLNLRIEFMDILMPFAAFGIAMRDLWKKGKESIFYFREVKIPFDSDIWQGPPIVVRLIVYVVLLMVATYYVEILSRSKCPVL